MYSKFNYCAYRQVRAPSPIQMLFKRRQQKEKEKIKRLQLQDQIPQIMRTKTIKKSIYQKQDIQSLFSSQKKSSNKSESSVETLVLEQLANYMKQKASQIPRQNRCNWQQYLFSSEQKSNHNKSNRIQQKKIFLEDLLQDYQFKDSFSQKKQCPSFKKYNKKQKQCQEKQNKIINRVVYAEDSYIIDDGHLDRNFTIKNYDNYVNGSDKDIPTSKKNLTKKMTIKSQSSPQSSSSQTQQLIKFALQTQQQFKQKSQTLNNRNHKQTSIQKAQTSSAKKQICSICLDNIVNQAKLTCKHTFCKACLMDWLDKNSKCPCCRQESLYYTCEGLFYPIEQKQYGIANYVDNIQGNESENDQSHIMLDYVCYACDVTEEGDEILICDGCFSNGCHVQCDPPLKGKAPAAHRNWYCEACRLTPNKWFKPFQNF